MTPTLMLQAAATLAALAAAFFAFLAWRAKGGASEAGSLRLRLDQIVAGSRAEAETTRQTLAATERALILAIQTGTTGALERAFAQMTQTSATVATTLAAEGVATRGALEAKLTELREASEARLAAIQAGTAETLERAFAQMTQTSATVATTLAAEGVATRTTLETKLNELRDANEARLLAIQRSVNEQLHEAVEKQMSASFARVTEQFAAVQKAMGDVQAVTAQIGDLKRLFGNVKTRGGWGEAQLQALLEDMLPEGSWTANARIREKTSEVVEFAVHMPMRGSGEKPLLAIDAKFPTEDYDRLLQALEAGDAKAEQEARRALERRLRLEAATIAAKYIAPPRTVEFAVLYLPTDGLYLEAARMPGLIAELGRKERVMVMGPSLLPALLRTIHLGFVTLAIEQNAGVIREILGAVRTEMGKMDKVLVTLGKQAGTMGDTIEAARQRTRVMDRKLRGVEAIEPEQAEKLLELDTEESGEDPP
ncbi:MAG: DNA recombination protein RmuC [Acetobacteraceae bacterium]